MAVTKITMFRAIRMLGYSLSYALFGLGALLSAKEEIIPQDFWVIMPCVISLDSLTMELFASAENHESPHVTVARILTTLIPAALCISLYLIVVSDISTKNANIYNNQLLFWAVLLYLSLGRWILASINVEHSIVALSISILRLVILVLPYISTKGQDLLISRSCVKEAVVVSMLIDTCIDKLTNITNL